MFQLSLEELAHWRSQIATSNPGAKIGLRRPPCAFTEHGSIMAATVLNSDKVVEMSLFVVRAFVRLRNLLATNKELAAQLRKLERRLDMSDEAIAEIYAMVRQLMTPPAMRPEGCHADFRVDDQRWLAGRANRPHARRCMGR